MSGSMMRATAWLKLELKQHSYSSSPNELKIVGVTQNRPLKGMAVKVLLDVDLYDLQPEIHVTVPEDGVSHTVIVEELEEPIQKVRRGSGEAE